MTALTESQSEERKHLASFFDHTLLKPMAAPNQIEQWCREAIELGFFSVCVNSWHLPQVQQWLAGSQVKTCTVIGFPLGANLTSSKVAESSAALEAGADELDMVLAIGHLKAGELAYVERDIAAVVNAASGALVKVILETCYLDRNEIQTACRLAVSAGSQFVKTSTGFGQAGATVADVALMRQTVGPDVGVKASGGIRDLATARAMIAAGANRLGASAGVSILQELG